MHTHLTPELVTLILCRLQLPQQQLLLASAARARAPSGGAAATAAALLLELRLQEAIGAGVRMVADIGAAFTASPACRLVIEAASRRAVLGPGAKGKAACCHRCAALGARMNTLPCICHIAP